MNAQSTFEQVFDNLYYINGGGRGQNVFRTNQNIIAFGGLVVEDQNSIGIALVYNDVGLLIDTIRYDSPLDTVDASLLNASGIFFDPESEEFHSFFIEYDGPLGSLGWHRNTLIRMDNMGSILSENPHEEIDAFDYGFRAIKRRDSNYFACGVSVHDTVTFADPNAGLGFLMKLDEIANQVWVQRFDESVDIDYFDINESGEFILGSYDYQQIPPGNFNDHLIIKCDSGGSEQWRMLFEDENNLNSPPIEFTNDGEILLISRKSYPSPNLIFAIRFIKIKDMGTFGEVVQDVEYFHRPLNAQSPRCLKEDAQGNIFGGGGYQYWNDATDSLRRPAYLIKLNSNLDSLWFRSYLHYNGVDDESAVHRIRDINFADDNCILLVGDADESLESPSVPGLSHIWTLKVDSMGCLEPGCHLLSGMEEIIVGLQYSMKVFPNPVQDELNVQWDLPQNFRHGNYPNQRLVLIDQLGRQVYSEQLLLNTVGNNQQVNLSSISAGFYTLHWLSANKWLDSVKLVKQ